MINRTWTWTDEMVDVLPEEEMEKRTPLLNDLAKQWSMLHDHEEQARFARQADYDDDRDYEPEDEADAYRVQQMRNILNRQHAAQVDVIENAISELGARMMRPYEHWNEDERYMQYMECDRYGDSAY